MPCASETNEDLPRPSSAASGRETSDVLPVRAPLLVPAPVRKTRKLLCLPVENGGQSAAKGILDKGL